jgi:hypothetical protein
MTPEERAAYDAMLDALYSINEVDDMGDGIATVNIDYAMVEKAFDLIAKVAERA